MSKKAFSIPEGELQVAHRRVESFGKRFGQAHLVFACHAAFPLALTPDLLYCLWANFQCDIKGRVLEIPWIAVADLLVSALLSEVGYEIYQMDRVVRNILLNRLKEDENFGQQRISELAQFLLAFVQPQWESDDPDLRDFALAQQWTALAYTKPTEAVRLIAEAYPVSFESGTELVRMESLVKTLAQPLAEFQTLLIYASSLGNFARGKLETAVAQLREVPKKGNAIEVAGVSLLIPKQIQTPLWQQKAKSPTVYKPQRLPAPANMTLTSFDFEVVTVNAQGQVTEQRKSQAKFFSQDLGNGVSLDMVAIPGGTFIMGSPPSGKESPNRERPQHEVTVPPFFMGKYQVTQAQWRVVAEWEPVERELDVNPAYFKDREDSDLRPVEQVSWYDAKEFCARLSQKTKRDYRLPTEAEWEYACRAGTTTPFHFGATITGELANYFARQTYAEEPKGKYRRQTTPVGSFPPNSFGLYDMHGNVWEWCADTWHENYDGAPADGSAWLSDENYYCLPRGGSWNDPPPYCRSAFRSSLNPVGRYSGNVGLRVVRAAPRTH